MLRSTQTEKRSEDMLMNRWTRICASAMVIWALYALISTAPTAISTWHQAAPTHEQLSIVNHYAAETAALLIGLFGVSAWYFVALCAWLIWSASFVQHRSVRRRMTYGLIGGFGSVLLLDTQIGFGILHTVHPGGSIGEYLARAMASIAEGDALLYLLAASTTASIVCCTGTAWISKIATWCEHKNPLKQYFAPRPTPQPLPQPDPIVPARPQRSFAIPDINALWQCSNTINTTSPERQPQLCDALDSFTRARTEMKIPLLIGASEQGITTCFDLVTLPHLLIAGNPEEVCEWTKAYIASIIAAHTPETCTIMLAGRNTSYETYDYLPHLRMQRILHPEELRHGLQAIVTEMEARLEHPQDPAPFLVCIIDAWHMYEQNPAACAFTTRLIQRGHTVGIHSIIATDPETRDIFFKTLTTYIPARISGKTESRTTSHALLGTSDATKLSGSDMLVLHPTDGLYKMRRFSITTDEHTTLAATYHDIVSNEIVTQPHQNPTHVPHQIHKKVNRTKRNVVR